MANPSRKADAQVRPTEKKTPLGLSIEAPGPCQTARVDSDPKGVLFVGLALAATLEALIDPGMIPRLASADYLNYRHIPWNTVNWPVSASGVIMLTGAPVCAGVRCALVCSAPVAGTFSSPKKVLTGTKGMADATRFHQASRNTNRNT